MLRFTLLCTSALAVATTLPAQSLIIDGDLEGHTPTPTCHYNVRTLAFNTLYSNVTSFGLFGGIDIMGGGCFGSPPVSGRTKLGLAWNGSSGGDKDAMSLDLTAPLTVGNVYSLSFYAEHLAFGTNQVIEIGVSASSTSFGTLVFSGLPGANGWKQLTGMFIAPIAATHLTVRPLQNINSWTGVDDFVLKLGALGLPSAQTVRLGVPGNPAALLPGRTSAPIIGQIWDPIIDHTTFMPNATVDVIIIAVRTANSSTPPYGTVLCDLSTAITISGPAPMTIRLPIPFSTALVGLKLCTQGVSGSASAIQLTNALDITIGTR